MNITPKRKMRNGQNRTATKKLKGDLQMSAARTVKKGYPVPARIFSPEEITEYFSHEKITCLLCGRELSIMSYHLKRIHGLTTAEYKERYGFNYRYGLTSNAVKEKMRVVGSKMYEKYLKADAAENRAKAHKALRDKGQRVGGSRKKYAVLNTKGRHEPPFSEDDFYRILNYMESNSKILAEACADLSGVVRKSGRTAFMGFVKNNPAHREEYKTLSKKIYALRGMSENGKHLGKRQS